MEGWGEVGVDVEIFRMRGRKSKGLRLVMVAVTAAAAVVVLEATRAPLVQTPQGWWERIRPMILLMLVVTTMDTKGEIEIARNKSWDERGGSRQIG